jgi:hypothetical protein
MFQISANDGRGPRSFDFDDDDELTLDQMLRIEDWASSDSAFGSDAKETAMWQVQTAMTISSMCTKDQKNKVEMERASRIAKARQHDPHNLLESYIVAHGMGFAEDQQTTAELIVRIEEDAI